MTVTLVADVTFLVIMVMLVRVSVVVIMRVFVVMGVVCFFLGVGVVFVLMLIFEVIFLAMMLCFEVIFLSVIVGVFVIFLAMMMLGMMVMILKLLPIFTLNFAHHKVDEEAANDSAHCLIAKD